MSTIPSQTESYLHGAGLSEDAVKSIVSSMVNLFGKPSLQISDKPDLEREFIRLVSGPSE